MSRAAGLSSVNCTRCGAGLSVLGGGRVLTHVCGYCGAVLDSQDNYKLLASIGKRDHPESPIRIGMSLTIEGAQFTVIGTIGKAEKWKGRTTRWVEHQVFSDTHGYGWLSYEGGNFTFTRKVRDFDLSKWLESREVERSDTPPTRRYRKVSYKYYETTFGEIEFMEGEFNWTPQLGDKTTAITLLGPDRMLTLRKGLTEKEVEETRLLPRDEVIAALGLTGLPARASRRHPLALFEALPEEPFLRVSLATTTVAAVLLAIVLGNHSGTTVLQSGHFYLSDPAAFSFDISNTEQMARIRYNMQIDNDWAVLGTRITGPDGEVVIEGQRLIEYYSGRDSDGNWWSEGSRNGVVRFRPQSEGPHRIEIERTQGTGGTSAHVRIAEGKPTTFWLIVTAVLFGLGYAALAIRKASFHKNRFSGSDWYD